MHPFPNDPATPDITPRVRGIEELLAATPAAPSTSSAPDDASPRAVPLDDGTLEEGSGTEPTAREETPPVEADPVTAPEVEVEIEMESAPAEEAAEPETPVLDASDATAGVGDAPEASSTDRAETDSAPAEELPTEEASTEEGAPEEAPTTEDTTGASFADVGLHPGLVELLTEAGYDTPTPVQEQAIPALLAGGDVIGQAQTGTGKTAAFSLPMIQSLDISLRAVQGLVLCPTRELALQVTAALEKYGASRGVRALTVYGGTSIHPQVSALRRGVHIVVGTPGRVLDCIRRGALSLDTVEHVVLDEADEMLRMGFIEDVETILAEVPAERQTALFSATMPPVIRRVAEAHLRDPIHVKIDPDTRAVDAIDQRVLVTHHSEKVNVLCRLIEAESTDAVLVFARTRASCGDLVDALRARGFAAAALHGDLSQDQREEIVARLRARKIQLVIATDIAARGLDVEGITHVINFDPPTEPETYVHRIGRTGRAGRAGVSILLVTPREHRVQRAIEGYLGTRLTPIDVPTNAELLAGRVQRFTAQVREAIESGGLDPYRAAVASILADGETEPEELAAALAKLATRERPLEITEPEPRPATRRDAMRRGEPRGRDDRFDDRRSGRGDRRPDDRGPRGFGDRGGRSNDPEPGYRRLFLPVGHFAGLRPGDLVGAIANESGVPGKVVGAIDIREKVTFVDVTEEVAERVLDRMRHVVIRGRKTSLSIAREGSWERRGGPPRDDRRGWGGPPRGPGGPRRDDRPRFDRSRDDRRGPRDDGGKRFGRGRRF